MDITGMLEVERKKEEQEEERRMIRKLDRQITIFNKEKSAYSHRKIAEIAYQKQLLALLDEEKNVEVDNYLATQSSAIEKKFKKEQDIVRELVTTADTIDKLTLQQKEATQETKKKLHEVKDRIWYYKKESRLIQNENNKFRLPDTRKMDNRCEWANSKFYEQLIKNRKLKEKIELSKMERQSYMMEEKKLRSEIDCLRKMLYFALKDIADMHQRRDQTKTTKLKVKEHLTKMKEQCERELLSYSLALCDDKKMEAFMSTKHKDNTQKLREQRERFAREASNMVQKKDEYSIMFERIKVELGQPDMASIIQDFVEKEESNFSLLLEIKNHLQDNEDLRTQIREVRASNIELEDKKLSTVKSAHKQAIRRKKRILEMKKSSESALQRTTINNGVLDSFQALVHDLINLLNIPKESVKAFIDKDGHIRNRNLLGCMAAVEAEIGLLLRDYYLVELMHRDHSVKAHPGEENIDQLNMIRRPSFIIADPTPLKIAFLQTLREKEELEPLRKAHLMPHEKMKDLVLKLMANKLSKGEQESTKSKTKVTRESKGKSRHSSSLGSQKSKSSSTMRFSDTDIAALRDAPAPCDVSFRHPCCVNISSKF